MSEDSLLVWATLPHPIHIVVVARILLLHEILMPQIYFICLYYLCVCLCKFLFLFLFFPTFPVEPAFVLLGIQSLLWRRPPFSMNDTWTLTVGFAVFIVRSLVSEALGRLVWNRKMGLGSWPDSVTSPVMQETVEALGFFLAQWLPQEEPWTMSQETQSPAPVLPLPAHVRGSGSFHFSAFPFPALKLRGLN